MKAAQKQTKKKTRGDPGVRNYTFFYCFVVRCSLLRSLWAREFIRLTIISSQRVMKFPSLRIHEVRKKCKRTQIKHICCRYSKRYSSHVSEWAWTPLKKSRYMEYGVFFLLGWIIVWNYFLFLSTHFVKTEKSKRLHWAHTFSGMDHSRKKFKWRVLEKKNELSHKMLLVIRFLLFMTIYV